MIHLAEEEEGYTIWVGDPPNAERVPIEFIIDPSAGTYEGEATWRGHTFHSRVWSYAPPVPAPNPSVLEVVADDIVRVMCEWWEIEWHPVQPSMNERCV